MEPWYHWLESLSDKAFFNLYRNYRGPVSTPYNKQELVKDLSDWLIRDEVKEQLFSRLTQEDSYLLSVIYYGSGLSIEHLINILPTDTRQHLENLNERLLILVFTGENESTIINPLLEDFLISKGVIGLYSILDCMEQESQDAWVPDNPFILGFLAFMNEQGKVLLNQGVPSKRLRQDFTNLFNISDQNGHFLEALLFSLSHMGLLIQEEERCLLASKGNIESFGRLSPREKRNSLLHHGLPELSGEGIFSLLELLAKNPGISVSRNGIEMLFKLSSSSPLELDASQWDNLFNKITALGVLIEKDGRFFFNKKWNEEPHTLPPPILQPNGDILLGMDGDFIWSMVYTCHFVQYGSLSQFHVDRDSFQRGRPYLVRGQEWIKDLEGHLGFPLDSNFKTLIEEWDRQFYSMEMDFPVKIDISSEHRSLVEKSGVLDPYTLDRTLGGAWILPRSSMNEWLESLGKVGISYVIPRDTSEKISPQERPTLYPWKNSTLIKPSLPREKQESGQDFNDRLSQIDPFCRKELESRMERGVLLFPWQVREDIMRGELRQIGGFDYNGKIRMIDMALETPVDRLEFRIPQDDFDMKNLIVVPIQLENRGPEALLRCKDLESDQEITVPVRKITQLQRFPQRLI